jgi:hypothetical protein
MRILIVTPLYPPDIKEPAPYVKELASKLSLGHAVTVLAFNHIPEQITGVEIIPIEKSRALPIRIAQFYSALLRTSRDADIIYVQNGPSVEVPVLLFSMFNPKPIFLRLGDEVALEHAQTSPFLGHILRTLIGRVRGVITHTETSNASVFFMKNLPSSRIHNMERPLSPPEILPFAPYPTEAKTNYETSWNTHVETLTSLFEHGN